MDNCQKIDFVLASASPRRKKLLQKAGYSFVVEPSGIDEAAFDNAYPVEHAKQLAFAKANDIAKKYPDTLVLGADTIAECDGRIIGKPIDANDAEEITKLLFSRPHRIITGVALVKLSENIRIIEVDTTTVYPRKMTEMQIRQHIEGGTWQGKAGAYAIQETGDEFVEKLDGSLTNVMGLPMELVVKLLGGNLRR